MGREIEPTRIFRRRRQVAIDGLLLKGRSFRSLSAVAFHITGVSWNGHRFFGLRKPSRVAPKGLAA
ncbi:DUF2924 domain-containing protein [Govanella unica]|uniref:DUF2924 domain-containing protein n=1 Tax=Govanella unica TaxID=2975056 RepID=UPI003D1F4A53